jgi:hypothetical protein
MSEIKIKRRIRSVSITLGTATAAATALRLDDMAGGIISVGTMATSASTLQMFGATEEAGPYRRVYGADGSAADVTLAPSTADGRIYSLPDSAYALPYVRIVSGNTHATAVPAVVVLKS